MSRTLIDTLEVADGEYTIRLFDNEYSGEYDIDIKNESLDEIVSLHEKHIIYNVFLNLFYTMKRVDYKLYDLINEPSGEEAEDLHNENIEYYENMLCALVRSMKALLSTLVDWR